MALSHLLPNPVNSVSHNVTNVAQAGVSEYKILKQIRNADLDNYDAVIVSHNITIIAKAKISNIAKNVAECYSYHCNIDVCFFVTVMSFLII